jgi:hypothetical protein
MEMVMETIKMVKRSYTYGGKLRNAHKYLVVKPERNIQFQTRVSML